MPTTGKSWKLCPVGVRNCHGRRGIYTWCGSSDFGEQQESFQVFQMDRLPLTNWLYLILPIVFVNDSIQTTIVAFEFWASLFRRSWRSTVFSFFFGASEIHPLVAESAGEHNLEVGKLRTEFQVEVPQQFSFRQNEKSNETSKIWRLQSCRLSC